MAQDDFKAFLGIIVAFLMAVIGSIGLTVGVNNTLYYGRNSMYH